MNRFLANVLLTVSYACFGLVALGLRLFGWRRGLLRRHLERCLPEVDESDRRRIEAEFYGFLGELAAEVACERWLDRQSLAERMRFENPEPLERLLAEGKRVLILSSHHSNWEWLLLRCSTGFDVPLTAAYKPLSRETFDKPVCRLREKFGCTMVPAPRLVTHLLERRGQVKLLAMLADQSPAAGRDQQLWLDFFGHPTSFFQGPGWIAAKMGFVPYFAAVTRERRGRYVVRFVELSPPGAKTEPERILEAYVRELERHVRAHPGQYFWAYNRWKREKPLYG